MSDRLYDLDVLRKMVNNDEEFMNQMIAMFIDKVPLDIQDIEQSKSTNEWDKVGKIAHKIKSSLKMMGAHTLVEMAVRIETLGKEAKHDDEMKDLTTKFLQTLNIMIEDLKTEV